VSSNGRKCEIASKGVMWGHMTQFWNFVTPLISREQLELETSNLVRRRTSVTFNEKKMQNWVKRVHVGAT